MSQEKTISIVDSSSGGLEIRDYQIVSHVALGNLVIASKMVKRPEAGRENEERRALFVNNMQVEILEMSKERNIQGALDALETNLNLCGMSDRVLTSILREDRPPVHPNLAKIRQQDAGTKSLNPPVPFIPEDWASDETGMISYHILFPGTVHEDAGKTGSNQNKRTYIHYLSRDNQRWQKRLIWTGQLLTPQFRVAVVKIHPNLDKPTH